MNIVSRIGCSLLVVALAGTPAMAQSAKPVPPDQPAPADAAKPANGGPASLVVLFEVGSSTLRLQDRATLDRAARAFNEGRPIVMILTGSSDRVGDAKQNLSLSQKRATAVLRGLLDRGIPADHFQVLAKGVTELPVPTQPGVAENRNRSVEISWR